MSQEGKTPPITPNRAAIKMLISFLATLFLSGLLIFGGAGRINWGLGWLFISAWIVPKLIFLIMLRWSDPDL